MLLPEFAAIDRIEDMPAGDHTEVYHTCHKEIHPRLCVQIGNLATVTTDLPDLPEGNHAGMFIMRLHPRSSSLMPTNQPNVFEIYLPAATSHTFSTVFSATNM